MNFIYDGNKFNVDNTIALKRKTMDFKLFLFCCCTFQLISAQLQLCDSFEVMYYLVGTFTFSVQFFVVNQKHK